MWEYDLQRDLLYWDEGMFELTGVSEDDFSGIPEQWQSLVHPDDRADAAARFHEAIENGTWFEDRFRIIRPDGRILWLAVRSDVIRDEAGKTLAILGVNYDITEQTEAELSARRSATRAWRAEAAALEAASRAEADRNRLVRLTDNAPVASFEYRLDASGRSHFPFFSGNMPGLIGVEAEAIREEGGQAFSTVHSEDMEPLAHAIAASRGALTPFSMRYRLIHPRHGLRQFRATSVPLPDPDGSTVWYGNLFDVTEQEDSERQALEAAERLRMANARLQEAQAALERQELMLRTATIHGNVGLWSLNLATGAGWWNETIAEWTGIAHAESASDSAEILLRQVHPEDVPLLQAASQRALDDPDGRFESRHRTVRADGGWRHVYAVGSIVPNAEGEPVLHGALTDIHEIVERKLALEQALEDARNAERRLDTLTESVPGGLYEFVLHPDGRMTLPYANQAALGIFDCTLDEIREDASRAFQRLEPDEHDRMQAAIAVSAQSLEPLSLRARWRYPDGERRWLSLQSRPERRADGATVWYGTLSDVTKDIELQEALMSAQRESAYMARHDGLTGLPNRRFLDEELSRLLSAGFGRSPEQPLSIIRIDLDRFKVVNDTLGHDAGDAVLVFMANLLRASKRPEDLAARVGGDEFVVMITPTDGQDNLHLAEAFIEELRTEMTQPLLYDGRVCRFGVSFGVAHSNLIEDDPSRLLTYADVALYETKTAGRGGATVYTPALHSQTLQEREAADEVVHALESDQIVPFFQVQTCAESGAVRGFEVLARWQHPDRGILPPIAFLDTAARLKKTHLVDRIVFSKAIEAFRRCRDAGLHIPKLSFNVSTPRLYDRDFVDAVIGAHDEGVQIAVELLESILLEEVDSHILHNLDTLRDRGIQIEVDDFGSGRASIVGVMRINPDRIKLDQQLVFPLTRSPSMRSLVRHIIGMAEGLGVRVTAEGVESAAHACILRDLGADLLQGHHFGRAWDEQALAAFLRDLSGQARDAG